MDTIKLKNNTVWIVQGNDSFAIFSSKKHAKEYIKLLIEIWKKSIIRDAIPPRQNNRAEMERHEDDYQKVIQVGKDHYFLGEGMSSRPGHDRIWWEYVLMSNERWNNYYERFTSDFVIKKHLILK